MNFVVDKTNSQHPRKFLKNLGFLFNERPAKVDRTFLKLLSPEDQRTVETVWAAAGAGIDIGTQLYSVPKTLEQAAALFSHDADRYVKSMGWMADVVEAIGPKSVVDMGCGAGLLIRFLQERVANLDLFGVDASRNLVEVGEELTGQSLLCADYLNCVPSRRFELVICEFGYDNSKIPESRKPHSSAECGPASYCPGCAQDAQAHFGEYMRAWRGWATEQGGLALTGRMTDYTDVRAITLAAEEVGWFVDLDHSSILRVSDRMVGIQHFPAFYFTADIGRKATEAEIAEFYISRGKVRS